MSWVLLFFYAILIFLLINKLKFFHLEGLSKRTVSFLFLLKIFAGIALWFVYTYVYKDRTNSDIWKYFDDSKVMFDALQNHPSDYIKMLTGIGDSDHRIDMQYYHVMTHWYQQFDNNLLNDGHIIIRFNALVRLFSMGNYFTHSLIMSFLSFIGLCGIYKIIYPTIKEWRNAAAGIIFLLPSLLFWSSGVMKEGLMVLGLGVIIFQTFQFLKDKKWIRIIYLLLGSWLLFITKFYVLAALIPSLTASVWVIKNNKKPFLKFALVTTLYLLAGFSLKWIRPIDNPLKLLSQKQNEFLNTSLGGTRIYNDSIVVFISEDKKNDLRKVNDSIYQIKKGSNYFYWKHYPDFSDTIFVTNSSDAAEYKLLNDSPRAGSLITSTYLQPTIKSLLIETPRALFHSLFRPFIWEIKNPLNLLPAFENLLMFLLFSLSIVYNKKISHPAIFGFCIIFSFLLLLVMGLTTPVLGALVRYRIAAQPFFYIALLMCIDRQKLINKWSFVEKIGF